MTPAGCGRPTLVFDLDGTLSDSFDGIWRSVNHALERHGHPALAADDFQPFIGPPIDQTFRALLPEVDDRTVGSLVATFRERYGSIGYAENALYPDVPAMLERLVGVGFACGVCTSKRQDMAIKVLELFGLRSRFGFVSGGDVGVKKSDQLGRLLGDGIIDRQAVMIGDRASDLTAAADNGLRAIGVTWGFGSIEELSSARPWAVCHSAAELAAWLAEHPPLR